MEDIVRLKILAVMFCLAAGAWSRRRRWLGETALDALSRLVVDIATPCLIYFELCRTLTPSLLLSDGWVLGAGFGVISFGMAMGRVVATTPTGAFVVGLPNWVFLPLLIVDATHGAPGVRVVLLFNGGAQLALWTMGIATLRGRAELAMLAQNAGLWATVCALVTVLIAPGWAALAAGASPIGLLQAGGAALLDAARLLGQTAVPLSVFSTGAALVAEPHSCKAHPHRTDRRTLLEMTRALFGRLLVVPVCIFAILWGLGRAGLVLQREQAEVILLISAMPSAMSATLFAKRFEGEPKLAARVAMVSTIAALLTAPLALVFAQWL